MFRQLQCVITFFTLLTILTPSQAVPVNFNRLKREITNDTNSVAGHNFDYIIAGGGLTGLTVASLLSENENITILVIEQGYDEHDNPLIYDVRNYGLAFGTELDYDFASVPIPWRNNETLNLVGGKMLGGSGSLNGGSWTKGPKSQYDLLPILTGDDSWSYESFNEYMLRAEKFNPPNQLEISKGAQYLEKSHGFDGLVDVSFANGMFATLQREAIDASQIMWPGLQVNPDAASGMVVGVTTIPNMLYPDAGQNRSSPYTAYIEDDAENRPNLIILTGQRVTSIFWNDTTPGNIIAGGVHFQRSADSEPQVVYANREVLLAAGAMQSPQLLELSGVGDPAILEPLNITVVKETPGCGKHLPEQTKNTVTFQPYNSTFEGTGPPSAIAFTTVQQVLGDELANATYNDTLAALPAFARSLEENGFIVNATTYLPILQAQLDNLFLESEAAVEIFFTVTPASGTVGIDLWNLIPLTRGSIHINSTDPFQQPVINPNYFGHPLDLQLQTHSAIQSRAVYAIEPLSGLIESEIEPGLGRVPLDASYLDWEAYVKNTFTSVWHPIATLAMMKEELGGVVDSRLKVYGIENVRVIDASVLPVQLSAHLSSSLYGIAEKVAENIKEDWASR